MSYKRAAERAIANRNLIAETLKAFTDAALLDVVDCEDVLADALSRSGDATGRGTSDVSRPTENAALRLAGAEEKLDEDGNVVREAERDTWLETQADPIAEAIHECLGSLAEAAGALKRAKRQLPVILDAGAHLRGRKSSVDECTCCDATVTGIGSDRVKAGLCPRCYTACREVGMPDRLAFIKARRAWLDGRAKAEQSTDEMPPWPRFWAAWPRAQEGPALAG